MDTHPFRSQQKRAEQTSQTWQRKSRAHWRAPPPLTELEGQNTPTTTVGGSAEAAATAEEA
jgi:hypothetical protein